MKWNALCDNYMIGSMLYRPTPSQRVLLCSTNDMFIFHPHKKRMKINVCFKYVYGMNVSLWLIKMEVTEINSGSKSKRIC